MLVVFGPNIDSLVVTIFLLSLPALVARIRAYLAARGQQSAPPTPEKSTLNNGLTVLLVLHSLYISYIVTFSPPPNVFKSLRIPLTMPTPAIRDAIVSLSPSEPLPASLEALLVRLRSFDARALYVRFGHDAVQYCDYCNSFSDFGLFAAPSAALQYIRTIAFVGLLTIRGSGKRGWRKWAVGALILTAGLETWTLATVDIQFSGERGNVVMWHDRAWKMRHAMFLLLPICLGLLPHENSPPSPLVTLPAALQSIEHLVGSLQLLNNVRATSMREVNHRARVGEFWEEEARLAGIATQDEEIQENAERVGLGYAEGDAVLVVAAKEIARMWRAVMMHVLREGARAPTASQ